MYEMVSKWRRDLYILKKKYINIIFIINMVKLPTVKGRQHYLGCHIFRYKS